MRILLRRRPARVAIICCLTVLQGHLLWQATSHQHLATEFAGGASPAVRPGSSQPRPALATELTCPVCQTARHSLALPVSTSPVLRAAVSVSSLPLLSPNAYDSCQSLVLLVRAPPGC